MTVKTKIRNFIGVAAMGLSLAACSSTSSDGLGGSEISDPFETSNRAVFKFNNAVDGAFIHPLAETYNQGLPDPVKTGVTNVLRNLRSPVNLGNQLLQGDLEGAGNVVLRAIVNTTVGVGGVFDVAGAEGYEYEFEDFGQTLGVWGVGHGPYFVVPVMGPTTLKDSAGFIVDGFADPLRWYSNNVDKPGIYYGKVGLEYMTLRASLVDVLEDLERSSIDYYAATRSAYYQSRAALQEDRNSDSGYSPSIPDYDE